MTWLRRWCCVEIWFAVVVFVIGIAVSNSVVGQDPDNPPPARRTGQSVKRTSRDDPNSSDYRLPGDEQEAGHHKGRANRETLLATVKETLEAFKLAHGKKAGDDFFVVGTIDLQKHHAIVDFVVKQGVQSTAEFITDFVLGEGRGVIRERRLFGRAKNAKAAEVLRTKAKADSIGDRLAAFKLNTPGKKSPDDYFVIGTADLNSMTLHADVRFEILNGVDKAADFLIDFIFNKPKSHKGEWHVFFRARTQAQATDYRQKLRDWYDSLESQREEIATIYNAKTTARC